LREFKKVAVGGTFDELHRGHKILLLRAFEIGDEVVIGLSSDKLVARLQKPHVTDSYMERKDKLEGFLNDLGVYNRSKIIELKDAFGTSVKDSDIQALVVSKETQPTAIKINQLREKKGYSALAIIAINMVPSENCAPISTTKIRKGEIDHEGHLLKQ
jgi:pantetheine-phosphate adenylyltransferase